MSVVIPNRGVMLLQGIRAASTGSPFPELPPYATVWTDQEDQAAFDRLSLGELQDGAWTEEKNNRRCDLIDLKYAGTLTPMEANELAQLQNEMFRHRQRVAPLPLEDTRRLYDEILAHINASRSLDPG